MSAHDPGWRVTVSFTEPTFDLSRGREPVLRQWTWRGLAWTSDRAHRAALNVTDLKVTGGRLKCAVTLSGASA
jgi:hypothetical protein